MKSNKNNNDDRVEVGSEKYFPLEPITITLQCSEMGYLNIEIWLFEDLLELVITI